MWDEGNRKSKSLNVSNKIDGYNLFLLSKFENYDTGKNIEINGTNSFKIEIKQGISNSYSSIPVKKAFFRHILLCQYWNRLGSSEKFYLRFM